MFQKQLLARRAKGPSRVNQKQKKFLAMMEEETVIDDPGAKATRLLDYKKIEVHKLCIIMLFTVGQNDVVRVWKGWISSCFMWCRRAVVL